MGDDLAVDYFQDEDNVEELRAGGAYDSGEDPEVTNPAVIVDDPVAVLKSGKEEEASSAKSLKKKRKFEELKKVIKANKSKSSTEEIKQQLQVSIRYYA